MRRIILAIVVMLTYCCLSVGCLCVHDHFTEGAHYHYYNDLGEQYEGEGRLLQTTNFTTTTSTSTSTATATASATASRGNIRIYADYSFLQTINQTERNQIKRIVNITANYFYNIMKVDRLTNLRYPSDAPSQCSILTVPSAYINPGVTGDLGILVSSQVSSVQYIAKSTACALLKSNNRPIWGVMIWNSNYLEYDQVGFQKIVYVGIHEMIHVLGYSAAMYDKYPMGNPYRNTSTEGQYLTSPLIVQEMNNYFGCYNSFGLLLEDQDGTLIPSHSERKLFGNQVMIASGKKGAYFSRVTVALLASMGWYNVSYDYAEPSIWGKNRGCDFLNIDKCVYPEFCTGSDFACDWDGTAMGRCDIDAFAGSCKLVNYFTNTICMDQNYQLKNLNAALQASQRGGHNSRCVSSNFRKSGLQPTILNYRCYPTVCSFSKSYLYFLVAGQIIVCSPGLEITTPPTGMDGSLKCPMNFANYCDIKKTCPYHCNKNGACINGQCLCTGSTTLATTCLDVTQTIIQIDTTGGLLNALRVEGDILILENSKVTKSKKYDEKLRKIEKAVEANSQILTKEVTSINTVAPKGTFYDPLFGQIVLCDKMFGCSECTRNGCLKCPAGLTKVEGKCVGAKRI